MLKSITKPVGIAAGLAISAAVLVAAPASAQDERVGEILERYAADYLNDVTFTADQEFGVQVAGEMWTVSLDHAHAAYEVRPGDPSAPTFYYTIDAFETLARVDRGEVNAYTNMAKAFSTDVTPMDVELMEGANFDPAILGHIFHFWTRGFPEVINWADQDLRHTHGGEAGIFYYQPGFRSGFGQILPGQHVNEDERSRTNPFPSLLIVHSGRMTARINGVDSVFEEGQAMLIPAGVSHEFLNPYDEPAGFFLFMFGEGA